MGPSPTHPAHICIPTTIGDNQEYGSESTTRVTGACPATRVREVRRLPQIERYDPLGGAYWRGPCGRAGDFAFITVAGVTGLRDGVPAFVDTFREQLRLAGRHAARALATFGLGTTDIVDATIFVHPSVDIEPGTLLDELSAHMFAETAPAMTITCSASIYTSSLISIKLTVYKRSD